MSVALVGAGPGDPGLLTLRGRELLGRADVVIHDRLVTPELLAPRITGCAARRRRESGRATRGARQAINELMVEHARAGRAVVRLKGGDPFVFGRGGEESAALREAGIEYEVVPGVSSAFAVPAAAGIPVTHRELSASVTVVTGHTGDPGRAGRSRLGRRSAGAGGTLVILMGMADRTEIAARLLASGREPTTPVAVVHWGTTDAQEVIRSTLAGRWPMSSFRLPQ